MTTTTIRYAATPTMAPLTGRARCLYLYEGSHDWLWRKIPRRPIVIPPSAPNQGTLSGIGPSGSGSHESQETLSRDATATANSASAYPIATQKVHPAIPSVP